MSLPDVVGAILLAGATLYAVFGGADFGAGIWHLLSHRGEPGQGAAARARIADSIGPVWEANHVWLIFILVVLWSAFPAAFAAVMSTLYVPLALAAVGIVLRGSGFAFGHVFEGTAGRRSGDIFALSSLITPFFMGTVVGAIAAGEVPAEGAGPPISSWIGPLPVLIGVLFVASSAYISAVFLVSDSRRVGEAALVEYFRRRAIGAAAVAGVLAAGGLVALHADGRFVFDGLLGPGLPLLIASVLFGLLTLAGLLRGIERLLRPTAVAAVVAVIWGWGIAQHPFLLPGQLTLAEGAGAEGSLIAMLVVFGVALVVVVPALGLLFRLSTSERLE